jgi:transcriptional regulator with XRE-family HTH domain
MMELEKSNKKDAKSRIVRFLTKTDITLNSEEEKILARWEKADFLMRQGMAYADIILKLTGDFQISKFTADNDISSAQEVFARSRKLNKRYLAHLHLEDIMQDLKLIRKKLFKLENGEQTIPDEKEMMALAKLHDSYTRQLNAIPDDIQHSDVQKPVIIFELAGAPVEVPMDVAKAWLLSEKFIQDLPEAETLPDEPAE